MVFPRDSAGVSTLGLGSRSAWRQRGSKRLIGKTTSSARKSRLRNMLKPQDLGTARVKGTSSTARPLHSSAPYAAPRLTRLGIFWPVGEENAFCDPPGIRHSGDRPPPHERLVPVPEVSSMVVFVRIPDRVGPREAELTAEHLNLFRLPG